MALQFQPPNFVQPRDYSGLNQLPQTLDQVFARYLQAKQINSQLAQAQQQMGMANLQTAPFGFTPQQATTQAIATAPTGQDALSQGLNQYSQMQQRIAELGFQGQQAGVAKAIAQARMFQNAANQNPISPSLIPMTADPIGNQYIRTFNPETAMPTYQKVEPQQSVTVGEQPAFKLPPGGKYQEPPGATEAAGTLAQAIPLTKALNSYEAALRALPQANRTAKLGDVLSKLTGYQGNQYQNVRTQYNLLKDSFVPFLDNIKRMNPEEAAAMQDAIPGPGATLNEQLAAFPAIKKRISGKIEGSQAQLQGNLINHPVLNDFVRQQNQQAQNIQMKTPDGKIWMVPANKVQAALARGAKKL